MKNFTFLIVLISTTVFASNLIKLPYSGVQVKIDKQDLLIQREVNSDCIEFGMEPELFWSGDYAHKKVSPKCKKEFITSKGIVQPIKFNKIIETVGELEVLDFIKNKINKEASKYALIDCRPESWFEIMTIPSAINIPFDELKKDELFMDLFKKHLQTLGIRTNKNKYDFKEAKTIIIFCNGPWCSQSNKAINSLIKMGYPQEKIKWYRGGIHSWTSMSFTTIKPKVK